MQLPNLCLSHAQQWCCAVSRSTLRVMEVPQLAVALEAMRAPSTSLAAARATETRVALLCTAEPVFFTWLPDGRSIVAVRLLAVHACRCAAQAIVPLHLLQHDNCEMDRFYNVTCFPMGRTATGWFP